MAGDWLEQFEVRLDSLAQYARQRDAALTRVLQLAQDTFQVLAEDPGDVAVDVCLLRRKQLEILATTQSSRPQYPEELLQRLQAGRLAEELSSETSLLVPGSVAIAGEQTLVCLFHTRSLRVAAGHGREAAAALTEQIAHVVSRQLLERLESDVQRGRRLTELALALSPCSRLEQAARVVATDGANLLPDCRISVVQRGRTTGQLLAVTGVNGVPVSSEASVAIGQVAHSISPPSDAPHDADPHDADPHPASWETLHGVALPEGSPRAMLADAGVHRLLVVGVPSEDDDTGTESGLVLVIEAFSESPPPAADFVQQFARTVGTGLSRFSTQADSLRRRRWRRWRNVALLLTAIVIALIPIEFEIEVEGRVQPTRYRRIFAPDNGRIDRVVFENEVHVEQDTVLLELINPDDSQELGRVLGEIQTTLVELASAKSRRLSGDDPAASADEQRLATRLQSLETTRDLLQAQVDELRVVAPFDGTVFLQNAREEMTKRPVRRGQMLLRVVADDTQWQVDLEIPDHLRGYVADARMETQTPLPIRYLVRAGSADFQKTSLQALDATIRMVDGRLLCRGVAGAAELSAAHQRPGTAVVARISCGQRCLGFVWFREIIEMWRYLRFAWF